MKIGQHIAIYVDTAAPTPGLSQSDLDALRAVFDTRLYQIDTTAFGRESDIDHNGVVIVLMTNGVNELVKAADCSSGVVAGYFYGADIDPFWGPQFNNGEIFYALVPDPVPTLQSCSHTVAEVKRLVPVTFIHEFQHMISYRSEEHTSELQSQSNLVCRLLLEKKKKEELHYDYVTATQPECHLHSFRERLKPLRDLSTNT